jgi:anti-sigma regulatory factor (Ser/Thr protein kinase)
MATLIYLVLDPTSGHVRLASAGHLPPLKRAPDGATTYLEEGRSLPLGVAAATKYHEAEYVLEPGSTLLLYTDGLVEQRSTPLDHGLANLASSMDERGDEDIEALCDRLLATVPGGEDDVALLALRSVALAPARLELKLPAEPLELGALRRGLRRWLAQCEASDEESYDIILACNEAAANAIEHAYGPGDASVEVDVALSGSEVAITVRDFGSWRESRADNRGRGLELIEAMMDSVSVVTRPDEGTEVRMTRKLGRSRDGA